MASDKQMHILSAEDTGTAEKNIIQKECGILDLIKPSLIEYKGNGSAQYKMPHLLLHTNRGEKVVFIVGYRDKARWKDALGGQYGCLYIDEINTANMDFVREAMMRADYVIGTLNPDDPALPIYKEYINRSRPSEICIADEPKEILAELKEQRQEGWEHWFFNFNDSGISEDKKQTIIANVPVGTKLYKNKIQGIRCKATGLIFGNFEAVRNIRTETWVLDQLEKAKRYDGTGDKGFKFKMFTCGVDTAYSSQSADTTSFIFQGITDEGHVIVLDEDVYNNRDQTMPLAPSDTVDRLIAFVEKNRKKWGFSRFVFVDSADQATMKELEKYRRKTGTVYQFQGAYKKMPILDRIILMRGWIQEGYYIVLPHCSNHLAELNTYAYTEDGKPEDRNDHTINASQYGWLPYIKLIGRH